MEMAGTKVVNHRKASKQVVNHNKVVNHRKANGQGVKHNKVVKHNKALLPGWAVIACGILFVVGSVLLVLAGEALLTSRQVSVGQLQGSLQSQEALHNDLSTQVGLLSQPGNLLSSALSDSGRLPAPASPSHAVSALHEAQTSGSNSSHRNVGQPSKNAKPSGGQLLATASDGHLQQVSNGTGR